MTTALTIRRAAGDAAARAGVWPRPEPAPTATLEALERLEARSLATARDPEADQEFLLRVRQRNPSMLTPSELRRVLAPAWRSVDRTKPAAREWVLGVTDAALVRERRPTDRAIVTTWLDVFPLGAGAEHLAAAAAIAAERHDWPYRRGGRDFRLWNAADAVAALGSKLLSATEPDEVLRAAALTPGLYDARLVQQSLIQAANEIATASPTIAGPMCGSLLRLLTRIGTARAPLPQMVRGLLMPWRQRAPEASLQLAIQRFLLREVGDPRTHSARWRQMEQAVTALGYGEDATELTLIFKRWLVRAAFELFFKLVASSTNKPSQWDRRESFWREYLEKGLVTDARFILGTDAERSARAQRQAIDDAGGFGRISSGGNSAQSALLMKIGDLTITEWSNDGSCCFWQPGGAEQPNWDSKWYNGEYLRNGYLMQTAAARQRPVLWHALGHRGAWEDTFAAHIRQHANF